MKRVLTLWIALGVMYVALETVFRGYSHPSMLVVGGLCGLLVGSINQCSRFYNACGTWECGITAVSRGTSWGRYARYSACCGFFLCRWQFGRKTPGAGLSGSMSSPFTKKG